eukprot:3653596-Rhodomonas_salina.1
MYSTSSALARVWGNAPISADDPLAADGKIEAAKQQRRPGTIMRAAPQPRTQHVARPFMPRYSPLRAAAHHDESDVSFENRDGLSPGLGGSTLRPVASEATRRLDPAQIADRAREVKTEVNLRMGEMLQRELAQDCVRFLSPEGPPRRPLHTSFLSSSLG